MDDSLAQETEGLVRGGGQTHAEEWRQVEPSGEDEPRVDRVPEGAPVGGTPAGMTADDVEGRSELASYLSPTVYPAVREQLIGVAMDNQAPDRVVDTLRRLPAGRTFENVNDVWSTLGGHVESERF